MQSKFILKGDMPTTALDWGQLQWVSNPDSTGAAHLTVIQAELLPGKGHDFHYHPTQEEVITVLEGRIEQWIGHEKQMLGPGDYAFIPPGVVHASFNPDQGLSRLLAILGPSVPGVGVEQIDVSGDAPWRDLRR